ncbi:acetyltransferase [Microvirga pakistanensis]|uniref:acetyltransferase n=1 Tax=Microvirga pakistanensis TaxID=1682650 RepID=UPI00106A24CA|nr:acetyltransferase [Microvirga pakistanensis]
MLTIRPLRPYETETMFNIWRTAVQATHNFLSESDFEFFSNMVRNDYLPHCRFWVVVDASDAPVAFMGMTGSMIDALFVAPDQHGRGIGRLLVEHARGLEDGLAVDVNEQNEGARVFYRRMGFKEVGRSELDGTGRSYPLIHMKMVA